MDIAVLSDIHGNYHAFKRCVDYVLSRGIETFIFLGDYVGELAYPERTMEFLYELKARYECYFIKGNKEDYWLKHHANGGNNWKEYDSTTGALFYAYQHLTEEDIQFFQGLEASRRIQVDHMPSFIICHGSPRNVKESMQHENDNTYQIMDETDSSLILCGHSHVQKKIEHNGRTALNPGSVGVPLNSGGKTQFLVLHGREGVWQEEFISLEYDTERAIRELQESGLDKRAPYWCRITENLLRGVEVSHAMVLFRAMELCRKDTGSCVWPHISETYWKQAFEELVGTDSPK